MRLREASSDSSTRSRSTGGGRASRSLLLRSNATKCSKRSSPDIAALPRELPRRLRIRSPDVPAMPRTRQGTVCQDLARALFPSMRLTTVQPGFRIISDRRIMSCPSRDAPSRFRAVALPASTISSALATVYVFRTKRSPVAGSTSSCTSRPAARSASYWSSDTPTTSTTARLPLRTMLSELAFHISPCSDRISVCFSALSSTARVSRIPCSAAPKLLLESVCCDRCRPRGVDTRFPSPAPPAAPSSPSRPSRTIDDWRRFHCTRLASLRRLSRSASSSVPPPRGP
mmetsp:Transcript_6763/g.19145  ORF Transcript_6763/g.19145 Transcript_6763/m.19145 type:complete len:286 (-) Transcript_6763:420-1277(-)